MTDRVAVVVGGASGIGAAIVRGLAADGYRVTAADRALDGAVALAGSLGPEHRAERVEITDEESVSALFDAVADREGRLDVAVNCAGVNALGLVTELPADKFRRVVDVCLTGAWLVVKHAARRMAPGGSILSLSSLNSRQPGIGMGAYCAAKAGLSMLTEVAALELAPKGIRVNAIAPGLVVTPLTAGALDVPGVKEDYLDNTPLGRAGTPEEVAEAAVYISRAQWLTGEVLDLNGGAHMMRYPNVHAHVTSAYESVGD
ncbi:SDR family NAD(P)-dependent oxidoreductase [Streptomyces hirsutus]|uniref:SDR family NAD(P)-dependent oxidoreductase n=1 Tax=Streptomyces hirsutus TaxID=35620 RepID=UPI003441F304